MSEENIMLLSDTNEAKISDLPVAGTINGTDNLELSQTTSDGLVSTKASVEALGLKMTNGIEYTSELQTTSKKVIGAINEVDSKVDDILIPQFTAPNNNILTIDTGKADGELNRPCRVTNTMANSPTDLIWGFREVLFVDSNHVIVRITGLKTNGTSAIWTRIFNNGEWESQWNDESTTILFYSGDVINYEDDDAIAPGVITITLLPNRIARLDFSAMFNVAPSGSSFNGGINRDFIRNKLGIEITPLSSGTVTYYRNEIAETTLNGFSGTCQANGQFWALARAYAPTGDVGSWPSNMFQVGDRVIGTVYGTY